MSFERFSINRRGVTLSPEERLRLEIGVSEVQSMGAHKILIEAGERVSVSTMLVKGFMARYLEDFSGMRQLVAVHVPGEFVDLHAYPMRELDHSIATITKSEIAIVPHDNLTRILEGHEALARKLWFSTLLDAALHRAWLFRTGRLDAVGRIAHLFCEMKARLEAAGLGNGLTFHFPLTQAEVAEICGLTSVHINRALRHLREGGLSTFQNSIVTIQNLPALSKRGQFNPRYLYLKEVPNVTQGM